jgi:hypothetical protein
LTAIVNSATVSVLQPINSENSNFQQSPLIVPTFIKWQQTIKIRNKCHNNRDNSPHIAEASLDKDAILTIKVATNSLFHPTNFE